LVTSGLYPQKHITEALASEKGLSFSLELTPPKKSAREVGEILGKLAAYSETLKFISITYHQEVVREVQIDGSEHTLKCVEKKPGTLGISTLVSHYSISMPHAICGGFSRSETEAFLIDLNYGGIRNLLAVRGDELENAEFAVEPGGHAFSADLVKQISRANRGEWLSEPEFVTEYDGDPTDFCVGVAGYPESYMLKGDFESDIENLKAKADAGADFIVCQMCFSADKILKFRDRCAKAGIDIPVIPGIKIASNVKQLPRLQKKFLVSFPAELAETLRKADKPREAGVDYAINTIEHLATEGLRHCHFYTLNKTMNVFSLLGQIYK